MNNIKVSALYCICIDGAALALGTVYLQAFSFVLP